jgi:hydrogenase nickel incorporation protein HypB
MCRDCGCSESERLEDIVQAHEHHHHHLSGLSHRHDHDHDGNASAHAHAHDHSHQHKISVGRSLVELNDHLAMHNRERFQDSGVFVINMMSSPGAGKTRLLERTLDDLSGVLQMAVITGDLQTENDARRLEGRGATILPITTGTMCHLDADLVSRGCRELNLDAIDILFIENVGNLVCPASFDLGEQMRVVLMSTTEGEDKPLKYPPLFKLADVILLTKLDLMRVAGFDHETAVNNIHTVAPQAQMIELSARTGEGLNEWYKLVLQSAALHGPIHQASPAESVAETKTAGV